MITTFDTETTGLTKAAGNDLFAQPHLVEIYAMQTDGAGNLVAEYETLIKPPIPIPKATTKIHGITDYDVRDSPTFAEVYRDIVTVFFGSHTVVAHNLSFDEWMIIYELRRIGKEHHFPYPPIKFCTVEQSLHLKGHRLKNNELYEIATGKELVDAHQAKNDVMATFESYMWLKNQARQFSPGE